MHDFEKKVNELSNPLNFQEKINIEGYEAPFLVDKLELMLLIRLVEEKLASEKEKVSIGGPGHLGAGQEAIAVGISEYLNSEDKVFGAHRSHSHLLSLNPDCKSLFAEILGKDTGFSRGMGGSMHLSDPSNGFMGSVPIVSGTVPLAVGASFHAKNNYSNSIGVAYIGDGAMEEGIVHESLNLAKVLNAPTLFVVENNLFSSHMYISLRQPFKSVSRFAEANGIESWIVDGNDLSEVLKVSEEVISHMREGGGPKFIEAITYRHFGHVDFRRDVDVGVNRSINDLDNWLKRDPIIRLNNALLDTKIIKEDFIHEKSETINIKLDKAWSDAVSDPYPQKEALLGRVFKNE